jgi:hypothetical protein
MRTRAVMTFALMLLCLAALWLLTSDVALMQGSGVGARPTATPALPPASYQYTAPSSPEALPDLVVESIRLSPSEPYVDQRVTVQVTIRNVGKVDVERTNNFFLDFYINPETDDLRGLRGDCDGLHSPCYWSVQGYQVKAGEAAVFSLVLEHGFPDMATYNLWAQVDTPTPPELPVGNVIESNEDNNILGPKYLMVRTHNAWVQKDEVNFYSVMANTLEVVPISGTVGIVTNTQGLVIQGDSAMALGIFDEPPRSTWGLSPTIPMTDMVDYNMIEPDLRLNEVVTNDQRIPSIHAQRLQTGKDLVVAVWEDGRNGAIYGKDVYLRWSDDNGVTWQPDAGGIQVNESYEDHDRNDQSHPTVAVAPSGDIVVAWQDHRGTSFDIYVQSFHYDGGTGELLRCDQNGDCAIPVSCDAATEACNFRVDTGANDQDQISPDIAVDKANNFYVAWQDMRNGNNDIFVVRSYYTTTTPCPSSVGGRARLADAHLETTLAPDQVHLCWGADRQMTDFPSTTQQTNPSIDAVQGLKVTGIEYEVVVVEPGPPPVLELVVTGVISEPTAFVVATWVDNREGDDDIYLSYSTDQGKTFGKDMRLNDDKPPNSQNRVAQVQPATAINQWMKVISVAVPTPYEIPAEGEVEVPVTTMHIVWQDFRNSTNAAMDNNPDIYYDAITIEPAAEAEGTSWDLVLTDQGQQKVNDNDKRSWQTQPVWQGEPDVDASPSDPELAESDGYNAFVVWADGRNYGGESTNIDIYFRLFSNVGAPSELIGGNNIVVNDEVRLHNFDVDNPAWSSYRRDVPPPGHQNNPSIASTLIAEWPVVKSGYLYVAWDDDRIADPFQDRNIYFARSCMLYGGRCEPYVAPPGAPPNVPGQGVVYGAGAFVSEIFDSGGLGIRARWYTVDWHAWTDRGTYITLQTRMGNTRQEVLDGDWYPKRFPYPDDAAGKGAPLQGYSAPGQHIEDALGNHCPENCPEARFIQYRVNFWAQDTADDPLLVELHTPFLYDVILHYDQSIIYLPVVFRKG